MSLSPCHSTSSDAASQSVLRCMFPRALDMLIFHQRELGGRGGPSTACYQTRSDRILGVLRGFVLWFVVSPRTVDTWAKAMHTVSKLETILYLPVLQTSAQ